MKKFLLAIFLFLIGCEPEEEYIEVYTTDTLYVTISDSAINYMPTIVTTAYWETYEGSQTIVIWGKIHNTYDSPLSSPKIHGLLYEDGTDMQVIAYEDSAGVYADALDAENGTGDAILKLMPDSVAYGFVRLYPLPEPYQYGVYFSWGL